jgi:hypothetical protein
VLSGFTTRSRMRHDAARDTQLSTLPMKRPLRMSSYTEMLRAALNL